MSKHTALIDAIRQGPEPVIGYDEKGERQKAFNFGWNTKADRVWPLAEAALAERDELVAALRELLKAEKLDDDDPRLIEARGIAASALAKVQA